LLSVICLALQALVFIQLMINSEPLRCSPNLNSMLKQESATLNKESFTKLPKCLKRAKLCPERLNVMRLHNLGSNYSIV
jgi:hypothetical protein